MRDDLTDDNEVEIEEPQSLRDSLADAFDTVGGEGDLGAGDSDQTPATQEAAAQAAQRARDEQGRFAKGGEQAQNTNQPEPNGPQGGAEPQQGTIRVPPGLSAATKADFMKLPQHVQQDLLKWQQDVETAKTTWDQKAARFNRLSEVLDPLQERLTRHGVDEATFIRQLSAANDYLDRDPVSAMLELGRQKGVDWSAVYARLQGQPAPQQAQLPPQLAPMAQQLQALTQWATQQQANAEAARTDGHVQTVQQFAADPANLYFENVKDHMAKLLRAGTAADLKDAYTQACWASPEVRPLMLQAQDKERQGTARAKAAQARHASGSITGSPSPGASSGARSGQTQTVRGLLADAWDQAAS